VDEVGDGGGGDVQVGEEVNRVGLEFDGREEEVGFGAGGDVGVGIENDAEESGAAATTTTNDDG